MASHEHSSFLHTVFDSQAGALDGDHGGYGFLGRYRIDRLIGSGAMGAVFEAYDATLGRTLAIKTLHTEAGSAQGPGTGTGFDAATINRAILQEARAAAKLNHPHIVTVYDAGHAHSSVLGRELPFVAMELLHGQDLRSHLLSGQRLSVREAVALVGKLALALDHAHKAGVLHRDIKPANIFITAGGAPKLLDFGLAQLTRIKSVGDTTLAGLESSEGVVLGSPQYMSPEVVQSVHSSAVLVDLKSDIYSLAVVLYELLAGRVPFTAPSLELLQERIKAMPPEPLDRLNAAVPRELSQIIAKALSKKPTDRYRSAAQFARELRRWGQAEGHEDAGDVPSSPAPLQPQTAAIAMMLTDTHRRAEARAKTSSTRARSLAMPLLAAALLLGGVGLWWIASGKRPAPAPSTVTAKDSVSPSEQIVAASSAASAATAPADTASSTPTPGLAPDAQTQTTSGPVSATAVTTTTASAAAPTEGRLRINVSPWADIEVGGKKMGVSPPLSSLTLPAGEHTVVLRNGDFPPRSVRVRIEGGKTASVSHQFN